MRGFGLGGVDRLDGRSVFYDDWLDAPTSLRHELLTRSLERAVALGILTPEGKPTFKQPV